MYVCLEAASIDNVCQPRCPQELQKMHHRVYSSAYHKAKTEAAKTMRPEKAKEVGTIAANEAVAAWKLSLGK